MKLRNQEIALAMELHNEGVSWKIIAEGLGVSADYLQRRVARAKREGMV